MASFRRSLILSLLLLVAALFGSAVTLLVVIFFWHRESPQTKNPSPVTKAENSNDASNSAPITEEDRHRKFSMFSGPLHVGDAGFPYSFIVMSVQDERHVLATMRYGDAGGYDPGQEREIVWANIPTVGMASDHEYCVTKDGIKPNGWAALKDSERVPFKITGTVTYNAVGGETTVFVVRPLK